MNYLSLTNANKVVDWARTLVQQLIQRDSAIDAANAATLAAAEAYTDAETTRATGVEATLAPKANPAFTGTVTSAGPINVSSNIDATTVPGTGYALRVRGLSSSPNTGNIQFTDPAVTAQWGVLTVVASGAMNWTGTFTSASDERLKENIAVISSPAEVLKGIRGVLFTWIASGMPDAGVLAQEVQKVAPFLVHDAPDQTLAVNYNGLIAYLIEGWRDLDSRIAALEKAKG